MLDSLIHKGDCFTSKDCLSRKKCIDVFKSLFSENENKTRWRLLVELQVMTYFYTCIKEKYISDSAVLN